MRRISQEKRTAVLKFHAAGLSQTQIARASEVSISTVRKVCRENGLTFRDSLASLARKHRLAATTARRILRRVLTETTNGDAKSKNHPGFKAQGDVEGFARELRAWCEKETAPKEDIFLAFIGKLFPQGSPFPASKDVVFADAVVVVASEIFPFWRDEPTATLGDARDRIVGALKQLRFQQETTPTWGVH